MQNLSKPYVEVAICFLTIVSYLSLNVEVKDSIWVFLIIKIKFFDLNQEKSCNTGVNANMKS